MFVRLFYFLLSPPIVFLCGGKKCALPPRTTSWSPAGQEEKVREEDECVWGEGVTLQLDSKVQCYTKGTKGVNVASRPPERGPAKVGGLPASSLPWSINRPARMPDRKLPPSYIFMRIGTYTSMFIGTVHNIYIYIYIYMYIYIVIHRQICFVLSELISVARHTSFP